MSNLKVYAKTIEDEALEQINTLLSQDAFKDCKVRIMPDVHAGKGCVIGFTADLGNKVIPNIVGVDIGCGMLCVSLGHRDFNTVTLNTLDRVIRTYVPSGKNVHDGRQMRFEELKELYCYRELKDTKRLERSIGTLGGGNHFIEVDVAEDGYKYLIIHTGSRNLGKQVADYYQNLAYELMCGKDDLYDRQEKLIADYKAAGRKSEIESAIKELRRNFRAVTPKLPKDLCYLEGKYREQYLHDMRICQKFAYMNRVMIAQIICNHMGGVLMQICRTSLSASTIISITTPTSSVKVLSLPSTEKRFLSPSICVTDVFSEPVREMRIGTVLRRTEPDGLCPG